MSQWMTGVYLPTFSKRQKYGRGWWEKSKRENLGLEQQVELYINVLQDSQPELQRAAFESIMRVIQTAITSMISVPKPLKFLHHTTLKAYYKTMTDLDLKKLLLADILSVLAFTLSAAGEWVHYAKGI
ncbi:hypothetical protein LguiB_031932 [Lonicera macranthoides]